MYRLSGIVYRHLSSITRWIALLSLLIPTCPFPRIFSRLRVSSSFFNLPNEGRKLPWRAHCVSTMMMKHDTLCCVGSPRVFSEQRVNLPEWIEFSSPRPIVELPSRLRCFSSLLLLRIAITAWRGGSENSPKGEKGSSRIRLQTKRLKDTLDPSNS